MKAAPMLAVAVGLACAASSTTPGPPVPVPRLAGPVIGRDEIPRASRSAPLRYATTTTRPAPSASPGHRRTRRRSVVPPRAITMSRPASPPTPAPRGGTVGCDYSQRGYSVGQAHAMWDGLLDSYPWSHSTAFAVMYRESKGVANACNPTSTARGLMQILGGPLDPNANVALAYRMYQQRGWQPWGM